MDNDTRVADDDPREFKLLSDEGKQAAKDIKDIEEAFRQVLHRIGGTNRDGTAFASRNLALANTHMEDAAMRAVRHITRGAR